jgi:hypothetical protein
VKSFDDWDEYREGVVMKLALSRSSNAELGIKRTAAGNLGRWRVLRRWPTLLAVAVGALMWGADVGSLRELLVLLPLEYVLMAAVGVRRASWPVLLLCFVAFVGLSAQDLVELETALLVLAAVALAAGLFRRQGKGAVLVPAVGMVVFGGVALLAIDQSPDVARYLVAAGWFGHGLWDFAHLRANKTVSRSYAEWCGVLDVLVAAMLIMTA